MWTEAISGGLLALDFIYHRWIDPPKPPPPSDQIQVPLVAAGSVVPLLYGRCLVTAPILAYVGEPAAQYLSDPGQGGPAYQYYADALFVLGIPFQFGANKIYQMFAGDSSIPRFDHGLVIAVDLEDLHGDGSDDNGTIATRVAGVDLKDQSSGGILADGYVEYLAGGVSQQLVDPSSGAHLTRSGYTMTTAFDFADPDQPWRSFHGHVDPFQIPGYRGYMSAFLWNQSGTDAHWIVGMSASMPSYSFEVGSFPGSTIFGPAFDAIGNDCNPVAAIYDLLTGTFGKLGLDSSRIDFANFQTAALTLRAEGHGFSMAMQEQQTLADALGVVLRQIDGGMFVNPTIGKLQIKLIRADFDPATVLEINPTNCVELQNFAAGGWTGITNRVVVTFTDRINDYKPGTAIAESQANAVGQDGEVREVTLDYPGVTSQDLAQDIADRELQARSKPLMKCRAIVNRSFLRVLPGDVLKLNWPEASIAGIYFRVAGVNRGTLENPAMALDLIQDYFYVHRSHPPSPPIGSTDGTFGDSL